MAHSFPATLEFSCLRDIASTFRTGGLTVDDKIDIGQHVAHFVGSGLEWYRQRRKDVPDGVDLSLLERLLSLFGSRGVFGDDGSLEDLSDAELCDKLENAVAAAESFGDEEPSESGSWVQVLTIVIPILIEILKRRNG